VGGADSTGKASGLAGSCCSTEQEPLIQVGTPKRGSTQRMSTNQQTTNRMAGRNSLIVTMLYAGRLGPGFT
jgi:hypothetical protein